MGLYDVASEFGYCKDMQDDKESLCEAHDLLNVSLAAMAGMIGSIRFAEEKMRTAAALGHSTATDFADWLVREAAIPIVKPIISRALRSGPRKTLAVRSTSCR